MVRKFLSPKVRVLRFERDKSTGYWFLRLDWMWSWLYNILEPFMVMVQGADIFLDIQADDLIQDEYSNYLVDFYNGKSADNFKPADYEHFKKTFLSCMTMSLIFEVSETFIENCTEMMFLSAHNEKVGLNKIKHGRLYTCTKTDFDAQFIDSADFNNILWLCNVTWFMFLFRYPTVLYLKLRPKESIHSTYN